MSKYQDLSKEELLKLVEKQEKELKTKKYGLVWDSEKEPEQVVLDCENNIPILQRIKEKEIKTDDSDDNILIEGDNYHALTCLNYTHKGKIDVIYIDPPYNTGNKDFVYNDKYIDKEDGYRHSKWLNFMDKRLRLARNLLTEKGVIFISIDDNEFAQLKLLCDAVFGENNFLNPIIWHKKTQPSFLTREVINVTEYVLVYKNSNNKLEFKGGMTDPNKHIEMLNKSNSIAVRLFKKEKTIIGSKYNGELKSGIYGNGELKVYLKNDLIIENGIANEDIILEGRFKWSQEKINEAISSDNGIIYIKSIKTLRATLEISNREAGIKAPISLYSKYINDGATNTDATNELKNLFDGISPMDYPKPTKLIKYLIESITYENKNSTILDFFAGSGTTGQAILQLNKEDNGNRRFILCTNNDLNGVGSELAEKNPNEDKEKFGICQRVTYPRLEKVIKGYNKNGNGEFIEGLNGNLQYFKTDLIPVERIDNINDQQRNKLTEKAGQMIAIKENTFEEVETNQWYQIFENKDKSRKTAIYFRENMDEFESLVKKIGKTKTVLYVFSYSRIDKKIFNYLGKNIVLEDIPEPILEIYKEINLTLRESVRRFNLNNEIIRAKKHIDNSNKEDGARVLRICMEHITHEICFKNSIEFEGKKLSNLNDEIKRINIFDKIFWEKNKTFIVIGNNASHGDYTGFDLKDLQDFYDHIINMINTFNIK
ncbi:site-specific DNA-methyltransferase [bacterium]|nr:MAG: site-specific DNA-methyltransferase [bacterium]